MDPLKKYRKIRGRLEFLSIIFAIIIGDIISSYLGIYGKKLISYDTALSVVIIVVISVVLNKLAVKFADNWYKKHMDEQKDL